jgi:hypothetical protein
VEDRTISSLIYCETGENCDLAEVPSMWLMTNILPAINPTILGPSFWQQCLLTIIQSSRVPSLLPEVLRHCDISMVRLGILEWIYVQKYKNRNIFDLDSPQDLEAEDLRMLVEMTGGLDFVQEDCWGTETSPIFMAMRYLGSFIAFRRVLPKIGIDICELVRIEIETRPDGWTLGRLLSLWLDPAEEEEKKAAERAVGTALKCKLCNNWLSHPDYEELAWKRRVNRFKHGVDLNAPLSEEEACKQNELDAAIVDYTNEICLECHEKKNKSMKRWNILG